jgi:hypothetical protein
MARWRAFVDRHYWFLVLLVLFASFRLLALMLFRPGGFIADTSDYDFYMAWGQTVPMGYTTFDNLWTAYPPLFPALMLPVFEFSSRIPPWVEPRLFFHLLFGLELLLFEIGNLILIYRLAGKLTGEAKEELSIVNGQWSMVNEGEAHPPSAIHNSQLLPPVLYALMFAPVYTLLGWFEAMPLFFMLLGLDLLLSRRRWGWMGSAVAAALGFLIKLTPILLVPIAVRWLGARLSVDALRHEWFNRKSPGNLLTATLYVLIFVVVAVAVGLPLARFNPQMALSSFQVNAIRPPWQSIWALLDGYYGFGLVPVDMRNMQGFQQGGQWETGLPWGFITLAFIALYLWLYTRRYDWSRMRTPIALAGVSVIWLFLYSKGWSPQFVVWIVAFLVLLQPGLRGVAVAVALTVVNVVESSIFLVLLPGEQWIMVGTALIRTALLVLVAAAWLGQIWPAPASGRQMRRVAAWATWAVILAGLIGLVAGAPRAAQAYGERRLAEHPCRALVETLQQEAGGTTRIVATPETGIWQELYPWLRDGYTLRIFDRYDPNDRPAEVVVGAQMAAQAAEGEFWWVEPSTPDEARWSAPAATFFARPNVVTADELHAGACRATRVVAEGRAGPLATFATAGAPIALRTAVVAPATIGQPLPVVLYWQAEGAVTASYTVFTQLFDPAGTMVSQQDNLPVSGLAPTDTWQPGSPVRDPYTLNLPADAAPGTYQLHVGLYDAQGRAVAALADGSQADHLVLDVAVPEPSGTTR